MIKEKEVEGEGRGEDVLFEMKNTTKMWKC